MKPVAQNPYIHASFAGIARACSEFAQELEERRPRSRQEREQLAQNLRYLLIVVASRFDYGDTVPGSPEQGVTRAFVPELAGRYERWHSVEVQGFVRHHRAYTVARAADFVLGDRAHGWLSPGSTCLPHFPKRRAANSEADMRECLEALEALLLARREPQLSTPVVLATA
jgi:hypothetical protein